MRGCWGCSALHDSSVVLSHPNHQAIWNDWTNQCSRNIVDLWLLTLPPGCNIDDEAATAISKTFASCDHLRNVVFEGTALTTCLQHPPPSGTTPHCGPYSTHIIVQTTHSVTLAL